MENLKNDINELIYKTNSLAEVENKLMVTKVKRGWRKDKLRVWGLPWWPSG